MTVSTRDLTGEPAARGAKGLAAKLSYRESGYGLAAIKVKISREWLRRLAAELSYHKALGWSSLAESTNC